MKRVKFDPSVNNSTIKMASGFIADVPTESEWTMPAFVKLSHEEAFSLFRTSEWLHAVITRIIDDCVKVKPRIVKRERGEEITKFDRAKIKEIEKFFRKPNPNKESFRDIRKKFILDLLLQGRGAIEKVNNRTGEKLKEIYSLTVNNLQIRQDERGNLRKSRTYRLKPTRNSQKNVKNRYFNIDQCIHSVFRPVSDSSYGVKPIDVLCNAIATDILRSDYNGRFFLNNGETSGILSVEGMGRRDFKNFREYWKKNFKSTKNAHKLAIVNTKAQYSRMAITNRDMEFSEYGKEIRNKIMAVFHMQPFIMGIIDGTTGKLNSSEQVTTYKDGAIKPILELEAYVYTEEIINEGLGYEDYEISFDAVDMMDLKSQTDIDTKNLENMTTTVNEIRRKRGQDPVPWGDTPISSKPGGSQVDPDTGRLIPPHAQGGESNENKPQPKPENKPKKVLTVSRNQLIIDSIKYLAKCRLDGNSDDYEKLKSQFIRIMANDQYKDAAQKILTQVEFFIDNEEYLSDASKKIDKILITFNKILNK